MADMMPLHALRPERFETPEILRAVTASGRQLAEFKGVARSIPNEGVLINTLSLQEAKDSSAIENIVTTHDELFRDAASPDSAASPAAKEVARYGDALRIGFRSVVDQGLFTTGHLLRIQEVLEPTRSGFRRVPGTVLRSSTGTVVYTPPQYPDEIVQLMTDLERFINDDGLFAADPLVKMALIHHQFESIHPFYDGNGRTGRIACVLYLVKQGLLGLPILYLSRFIVATKPDYYRLLQGVRDRDEWEDWVIYMLTAVERTAAQGVTTIQHIGRALLDIKHQIRDRHKFYSQDLINHLFMHPYTKISILERHLNVSRLTASKYLEALTSDGILQKTKIGRSNYYINRRLFDILTGDDMGGETSAPGARA
jgi:Fic family protein